MKKSKSLTADTATGDLTKAISGCLLRDQFRFRRRLKRINADLKSDKPASDRVSRSALATTRPASKANQPTNSASRTGQSSAAKLTRLRDDIDRSCAIVSARRHRFNTDVTLHYPPALPVSGEREKIAALIQSHQVVIVCGETGSGKSTQLPKLCLELGRGITGSVAHTQPRRIAARTLAARLCEETQTRLGESIGYKVRFDDRSSEQTLVKVMTDGILLAELEQDRFLNDYDTIIVDEAHERSLNIDFLLGVLHGLLQRRKDLKVIITSATIDPERFSRHFNDAPVIEVSGRLFPVEVRYRPLEDDEADFTDDAFGQHLIRTMDEAIAHGPGDVLLFFPGEREIREAARTLVNHYVNRLDVLPLFARLSAKEQDQVFKTGGRRRAILATNIAETSITVPGIRFVIDTGVARISRYSAARKVQRLPIEKISRASALQRQGRCGRIASGVCFRLFAEDDYLQRSEFTDPEIKRSSLASVILRMKSLRLGAIDEFPFLEAPDQRQINDGYRLLEELGALDQARDLTRTGRRLASLPVDPRLGRMLLAGHEQGCLDELLVITSALAIQDPRVTPANAIGKARAQHALFDDKRSDFLTLLRIWREWRTQSKALSRKQFRQWCETHFLANSRLREWADMRRQLQQLMNDLDKDRKASRAPPTAQHQSVSREKAEEQATNAIHKALLTGLVDNVAKRDDGQLFQATRNRRPAIFPGSVLKRKPPAWIMAAELVETGQLYARTVAPVLPAWVEQAAPDLVQRESFEPHWEKRQGRVMAYERVRLYGLTLIPKRRIDYSRVNPREARALFIMHALVEGDYDSRAGFLHHNRELVQDLRRVEDKARRRDVLVDETVMYAFYDEHLPADICTARDFEQWYKKTARSNPDLLRFDAHALSTQPVDAIVEAFPDKVVVDDSEHQLDYSFNPGSASDGITVDVPLQRLNQIDSELMAWSIPGMRRERLIGLIRSLPKPKRRRLVPAPDRADQILAQFDCEQPNIIERLAAQLSDLSGVTIALGDIDPQQLDDHLRPVFRVIADDGVLAQDRDLDALKARYGERAARAFVNELDFDLERDNLKRWDFDSLPEDVLTDAGDQDIKGYPAIVDEGASCAIRVLENPLLAEKAMGQGLRRLLLLQDRDIRQLISRKLPDFTRLNLKYVTLGANQDLHSQLMQAVLCQVLPDSVAVKTRDKTTWQALCADIRRTLPTRLTEITRITADILDIRHRVLSQTNDITNPVVVTNVRERVAELIPADFLVVTPPESLRHLPRYLKAQEARIEGGLTNLDRDQQRQRDLDVWLQKLTELRHLRPDVDSSPLRWLIEEYAVSLFAQQLRTRQSASPKRLQRLYDELLVSQASVEGHLKD